MRHYCGPCQMVFPSGQEKSVHVVLKHSELRCEICGVTYTSKPSFAKHRYEAHGLYYCPFCSYIIPK